jgi:hypothetical protein
MNATQTAHFDARCLLTLCLLAIAGPASATLLTNGDFEAGLSGWTFTGDGTIDTFSLASDTPSGAGSSGDLNVNGPVGLPWVQQDVPVTTGLELIFTTSVKELRPNSPDAWVAAQVWMLPPSLASILSSTALFFTSPDWTTQTTTITVPAGATVARVLFTPQTPGFGVGSGRYLIDNVSLTVIPEPSALTLSAVTAALWAVRRRRRE